MANKQINARIMLKRDVESNWVKAVTFIPKEAECIVYLPDSTHTVPRIKIGDGINKINDLPFVTELYDIHINNKENPHETTASQVGLGNLTNDRQVIGLSDGITEDNIVVWGVNGYQVKDSKLSVTSVQQHIDNKENPHNVTKLQIGLENVTNDAQIKGLSIGAIEGNILVWGSDGYTVLDGDISGQSIIDHVQSMENPHNVDKEQVGLGNLTNDKQIKGLPEVSIENHYVVWGPDGYTVKDGGITVSIDQLVAGEVNQKIPSSLLPEQSSSGGLIVEPSKDDFPESGAYGFIYLAEDTKKQYYWNGTEYVDFGGATGDLATPTTNGLMSAGDKDKLDKMPLIYIGSEEPPDDSYDLWIDTDGSVITPGGGGGTTSVDGIAPIDGNVTLNAIRYVSQILEENEKNIARNNIGAATNIEKQTILPVSDWSAEAPYSLQVSVEDILSTDNPIADVNLNSIDDIGEIMNLSGEWAKIGKISTNNGSITAYCYGDKPIIDLPIIIKIVR